jgi:hypothetical protein
LEIEYHFLSSPYLQDFEEVIIPPARPVPPRATERLIPVSKLDPLAKGSFPVCPVEKYMHLSLTTVD